MSQTSYRANYNLHIFIYSIIITISFPCSINVLFGFTQFLILLCDKVFMKNLNLDGFKLATCDLQEPAKTFWYVIISTYLHTQFVIVFLPNIHYYILILMEIHISTVPLITFCDSTPHIQPTLCIDYILLRMRG